MPRVASLNWFDVFVRALCDLRAHKSQVSSYPDQRDNHPFLIRLHARLFGCAAMLRTCFAFLTAPSSRITLVSISRWACDGTRPF